MSEGTVRRKDKEMPEAAARERLSRAKLAHFGTISPSGDPYVVPNLFVYAEGAIWLHTGVDITIGIQPVIGDVLQALGDAQGAQLARMSGSGATCFALFASAADAQAAAKKIAAARPGWWVHAGELS